MDILTFIVLPIATIILAFVLQKLLRVPILTALTFFAIYLILAYTVFDNTFLINTIVYTVLAYIAALIAEYIYTNCKLRRLCCNFNSNNSNNSNNNNTDVAGLTDCEMQRIAQMVANILSNTNSCRRMR